MTSLRVLLLLFTAYSMLGWAGETVLCSVSAGKFINRGFLNGPFCPIYGFGALLICAVLGPVKNSLPMLFVSSMLLTGALEYATGFALETLFHTKYWDYSSRRFNLQGRVCLGNLVLFGIGGVLTLHMLQPTLLHMIALIPRMVQAFFACVLFVCFTLDTVFTANTLVRLNGRLAELQQVLDEISERARTAAEKTMQPIAPLADELTGRAKSAADETFSALSETKVELTERAKTAAAETIGAIAETKDGLTEKARTAAAETREALAEKRDALQKSISERLDESPQEKLLSLYESRENLEAGFRMTQRRIIRAFPTMRSARSNESLLQMREVLRRRKQKNSKK